jgi:hypothetical protein
MRAAAANAARARKSSLNRHWTQMIQVVPGSTETIHETHESTRKVSVSFRVIRGSYLRFTCLMIRNSMFLFAFQTNHVKQSTDLHPS